MISDAATPVGAAKENLKQNLALVDKIKEMAATKAALQHNWRSAWVLAQGEDIYSDPRHAAREVSARNMAAWM